MNQIKINIRKDEVVKKKRKKSTSHINIGIIKIEKATMVYNTVRSMVIKLRPSRHRTGPSKAKDEDKQKPGKTRLTVTRSTRDAVYPVARLIRVK
jgi:hypothetical protein